MAKTQLQQEALALPADERQQLAELLWESLEAAPGPLPDWQRQLIDERLEDLATNPDAGSPWEEVERRIWPKAG